MSTTQKLDKQNVEDILALTPVQEGMLFHYLNQPSSELYFEQLSFRLVGKINMEILKKAWDHVVETNEMLRTVFRWEMLEKPLQIVLKTHNMPIREFDFSNCNGQQQVMIDKVREEDRKEKIDISSAPCRIILCKINENEYEMILSSFHIIFDGWSNGIILKEFVEAYCSLSNGRVPERPSKTKYKEFVKRVAGNDKAREIEYWSNYIGDFTSKTVLPLDKKSDEFCTSTQNYIDTIPQEVSDKIKELSKSRNITTASILYSAWGLLLKVYNDSRDVVFGTTVSGRTAQIRGIENIVGLFINTPPLRIKTCENDSVTDLLARVDEMLLERVEFELSSLTEIKNQSGVDRKESLFDSIVVVENYPLDEALKDNQSEIEMTLSSIFEMTNYDLTLVISTFDQFGIRFIYDGDKFNADTIERLTKQFINIVQNMVNSPESPVDSMEFLSQKEKEQILFDFNNFTNHYDINKTIVEYFENQVLRTPDNIAVRFNNQCLTYKELNEKSNQLARFLREKGVGVEKVVGIMMERSLDMAVALMAILKAGGAYLPIDLNLPAERITYMLEDSGAIALITDSKASAHFQLTALQNFGANSDINIILTSPRGHIEDFQSLPVPDRSLININKYKGKIGMASVNNCISIQTTRGCPYKCLYCHKIWSKFHVRRTAQSIFDEIEYYYRNGVSNFAVIDDCFNLDMTNSRELFKLIIKNKLRIQLFFPNGLRGDILTPDYIDLMVEAGTRGVNLSLETASPRLQKLLKKDLDLDKFKGVVDYFASQHSNIILEMATMHGFPTETEEEAMMTLNFIKDIKWLHFPYVHILKIFPNTEMEEFALEYGVSKQDILKSKDRAFHELPETLPFPKSFTRKYQADFMNEYFLSKERLNKVLPVQMKILDEQALIQKYDAYLPVEIRTVEDIFKFAGIDSIELQNDRVDTDRITIFDRKHAERKTPLNAKKVLFLDLSQHFSSRSMLYKVAEQPIGHIYLLTYLKQVFGDRIDGRIYKSGIDFDSFTELKALVDEYKPDMIGIRTLTYFKEFFHETVMLLRQWGIKVPIITGGPYGSSDYDTILKDKNVDLVILGEGEYTLSELVERMFENGFSIPSNEVLQKIKGIAFLDKSKSQDEDKSREVLVLDQLTEVIGNEDKNNLAQTVGANNLAYVMYTSGSTGKPKGVMVEHRQVNNCILWMQKEFRLKAQDIIVQRTNLSFDPSVWELFWPLYVGASVKLITYDQSRDAQYLMSLMGEDDLTMMYCPASLVTGMTYLLNSTNEKQKLKMPWLIIGAEPISMDTVKSFYSYFEGRIVNTYGPTECTINNTYYCIDRDDKRRIVPIGRPVDNNQLYVLSKNSNLMPLKAVGEIYIAGDSVARGYINNAQKTSESFLENPFGKGKLYKTGDLGRWLDDGNIEIMGRVDEQVKIRGYRIELGEIESVLLKNDSIKECVVAIKDSKKSIQETRVCKKCGAVSSYPGITIDEDGICDVCRDFSVYKKYMDKYFGTLEDLNNIIINAREEGSSKYDCLLLYSGGKGSAYALYTLVQKGYNVLAVTYDNGYFSKTDMENIKMITSKLGVDHVVLKHENTDEILKESINFAKTVCRGCFHTSSSLALEYAYKNGIKLVVGATLSRGQIIENKLIMFFKQGISDVKEVESGLKSLQKTSVEIDRNIFDRINIDVINDKSVYDAVKTVDFYRYCDISNEAMLTFLNEKDPYWESRKNYAIYSTNCSIKQIGDKHHLTAKGYHYYGSATCWERRMGHITKDNLEEDLHCSVSEHAVDNFLNRIGVEKITESKNLDTKYMCAYYVSDKELNAAELKENISKELPSYMVPSYFVRLENLPLTLNGKIDKRLLPEPDTDVNLGSEYIEPTNETEEHLVDIWKNILGVDRVGIKDNFFDIGGNSILLIQMHSKIDKQYPGKVSMTDIFAHTTIEKLSELIRGSEEDIRDIEIKTITFPDGYFVDAKESQDGAVFKASLKESIFEKIKRISEYEKVRVYDVFIGMYAYLISEITQKTNITVNAVIDNNIYQIPINLNELKGFRDLFKVVGAANNESGSKEKYSQKDLKNIKVSKSKYEIIPFIYDAKLLTEKAKLVDVYDVIFEIDFENMSVACEFDSSRLKREKIKELLSGYLELVGTLADDYEFK
ncbi:non-ribosomal peptide synthetase [Acetivibrio cellulolyticus]|uniref:non-ribosomal peptide synthetase n=1 Tax=Acetivibrio cellulolyticus TaxID=35830 RepID=UPI0001E2F599|nr:non-ribosomal peptide synthetase [Acetivibrio cellulolyticus]